MTTTLDQPSWRRTAALTLAMFRDQPRRLAYRRTYETLRRQRSEALDAGMRDEAHVLCLAGRYFYRKLEARG